MKTAYLTHLLIWMGPIIVGQWIIGRKILPRNWKAIVVSTLVIGAYLSSADLMAIRAGIWHFDPAQNLGWLLFGVLPIEECLFFFMTSLLVAQSFVLFLPDRLRHS